MIRGLQSWLKLQKASHKTKEKYYDTMKKQKKIGWNFFVRGLVITEWAAIQEQYFLCIGTPKMGDSWSSNISEWWIRKSRSVWNLRNSKLHDIDKVNESREEQEAFAQVRKLYETSFLLSANDRELFQTSMEDLIQQPLASIRTWIKTAWPTVKNCLQHHSEQLKQQNRQIYNYFQQTTNESSNHPSGETQEINLQANERIIIFESTSQADNQMEIQRDTPPDMIDGQ
jgi:hypothetical protein